MGDISGRTRLDATLRFGPNSIIRVSFLLWLYAFIALAPILAGRFPLNAHTESLTRVTYMKEALTTCGMSPAHPVYQHRPSVVPLFGSRRRSRPRRPNIHGRSSPAHSRLGEFRAHQIRTPLIYASVSRAPEVLERRGLSRQPRASVLALLFAVCCLLARRLEMKLKKKVCKNKYSARRTEFMKAGFSRGPGKYVGPGSDCVVYKYARGPRDGSDLSQ